MMMSKIRVSPRNEKIVISQVGNQIDRITILEEAVVLKRENPSYGSNRCIKAAIKKEVEKNVLGEWSRRITRTNEYRCFAKRETREIREFIDRIKELN